MALMLKNISLIERAEPLRKKKKADPGMVKAREEKKINRINREIRRLQKYEGQLKPIDECQLNIKLKQEELLRVRPPLELSVDEQLKRIHIEKQWSQYCTQLRRQETLTIKNIIRAQEVAMKELKKVSVRLWLMALERDPTAFPCKLKGPSRSLPVVDYRPPDGDYFDVSKKWE